MANAIVTKDGGYAVFSTVTMGTVTEPFQTLKALAAAAPKYAGMILTLTDAELASLAAHGSSNPGNTEVAAVISLADLMKFAEPS